jgi:hypothetical protein
MKREPLGQWLDDHTNELVARLTCHFIYRSREVIAKETVTKFEKLNASIADDVRGVREGAVNEDVSSLSHMVMSISPTDQSEPGSASCDRQAVRLSWRHDAEQQSLWKAKRLLSPGGAAPICYTHDATTAMIDACRQRTASR